MFGPYAVGIYSKRSNIGIAFWNLDGRILEANDALLRMVGYGRADLVSGRLR
jgi:PAS domain-containing protein